MNIKTSISAIIILIIFIQFNLNSQISRIDSLKKVIHELPNDSNKCNVYLELAQEYGRINTDTATYLCQQAIELGEKTGYYKGVANAYRQIGIIYYIKGENEKAIQNFTLSLSTWQQANDLWGVGRAYNNIGIIYKNIGEYDKALENYMKSSEIQLSIKDNEGLAISNNNIANIYFNQGNYGQALEYLFKSLKSHEELGKKELIAITYNNIGNIYDAQEDDEKALEYYQKALKISENIRDKKSIADIYNNMGDLYRKKGVKCSDTTDYKTIDQYYLQAISYYEKSLPLYSEIGYKKGIALSYNSLGQINLERKKYGNVLSYFEKSLKDYEEMGDKQGIGNSHINIASFYNATRQYNEALKYYIKAKEIADELNAPEMIGEIAEGMSVSYAKLGLFQKAYENHVLYTKIQQKIKSDETIRHLAKQELSYQVNKKQRDMELDQQKKDLLAQEKIRQQSLITTGAFIALAFMVLLAFFIYRSYRVKQKSNIMLAAQRDQILQKNEELKQLNEEITAQRELVEIQRDIAVQKEREITDSIHYAKRIQAAVLPQRKLFMEIVPDYFIYFKPRDIVSGDFYWMKKLDKYIVVAAADCTGHGVPGAFMSLLGIAFLNEIVNDNIISAGDILNTLRLRIIEALHQTWRDDEAKDGMDISLTVINTETKELQYAGAYNPIFHIRNNRLTEIKADKMPIGIHIKDPEDFNNTIIQLEENDLIYLFSDGYIDQFGGRNGNKFKRQQFRELLLKIQYEPMSRQKELINETYQNWRGDLKQLDDILIIGMRF